MVTHYSTEECQRPYLKKSLIELLEIAKSTGAMCAWTVEGRFIVFHTDTAQFSVHAVEAGSFLRQMILDAGITQTLPDGGRCAIDEPRDAGVILEPGLRIEHSGRY